MRRWLLVLVCVGIAACGREEPTSPAANLVITLTPEAAEILTAETTRIHADVTGTGDPALVWTVLEGSAHGTITEDGFYTAPETAPEPPVATIRAASASNPEANGTVTIAIVQGLVLKVSPGTARVSADGELQLSVEFEHGDPGAVEWSVAGGPAKGSVSPEGLYRAPAAATAGMTAIVEARTITPPVRVGRAILDLLPPPPAGEAAALTDMYRAGFLASRVSDQAVAILVEALVLTWDLTGEVRMTGVLTKQGERYVYAPDPGSTDLVIDSGHEPVTRITVTRFEGNPYAWGFDGRPGRGHEFQGEVAGRLEREGRFLLDMDNSSVQGDFHASPGNVCDITDFTRSMSGTVLVEGGAWAFDVAHEGETTFCSDGTYTKESVTGTIIAPQGITLSVTEELAFSRGGDWAFSGIGGAHWMWKPEVQATWNGATYAFVDVRIAGEYYLSAWYSPGEVKDVDYWTAEGRITKNGSDYGAIAFQAPVQIGTRGSDAVLDYGFGHRFVLQSPGVPEIGPLIANPFFD